MSTIKNTVLLLIVTALPGLSIGQQGTIAPLFGLDQNNSINGCDFESVNQVNGETVFLLDFDTCGFFGNGYAVNYPSTQIYFLDTPSNGQTMVQPLIGPELFSPSGGNNLPPISVQGDLFDIEYHHSDGLIYAINNLGISSHEPQTFQQIGQFTFTFISQIVVSSISMASSNNYLFLGGRSAAVPGQFQFFALDPQMQVVEFNQSDGTFSDIHLISNPEIDSLVYAIGIDAFNQASLLRINANNFAISNLGSLQNCPTCRYDKNAITLDPENNEILFVHSTDSLGIMEYYLSTYSLQTGDLVRQAPLASRISNLVFAKAMADLVFPGDADHNQIVDMNDVFPIGLFYNETLTERLPTTTEWVGQFAFSTGDTLLTGIDSKHADCNGDGQINALDLQAITDNFSSIHNSEKKAASDCDYQLFFVFPDSTYENNDADIGIHLGTTDTLASDVYGVTFTVEYPIDFVQQNSMSVSGVNSWFGDIDSNFVTIDYDEFDKGIIHVGVVGIDKVNRTGGGAITRGRWTMEDDVIPAVDLFADIPLSITNVRIIDVDENELDACGSSDMMRVYDKVLALDEISLDAIEVYPVPSSNKVNITIDESLIVYEMQLHSVTGSHIRTMNSMNQLDVTSLVPGVYFLQFDTNRGKTNRKIIVR